MFNLLKINCENRQKVASSSHGNSKGGLYNKFIKKPLSLAICSLISFSGLFLSLGNNSKIFADDTPHSCVDININFTAGQTAVLTGDANYYKIDEYTFDSNQEISKFLPGSKVNLAVKFNGNSEGRETINDNTNTSSLNKLTIGNKEVTSEIELRNGVFYIPNVTIPTEKYSIKLEGVLYLSDYKNDYALALDDITPPTNLFDTSPVELDVGETSTIKLPDDVKICSTCNTLGIKRSDGSDPKFVEVISNVDSDSDLDSDSDVIGWTFKGIKPGSEELYLMVNDRKVCKIIDVTVTNSNKNSGAGENPTKWPYLEAKVDVMDKIQRIRVYDPNNILDIGTKLLASVVEKHANIDSTHKIENIISYNISLTDENGKSLDMPLKKPVELYFEIIEGLDKNDLQAILVQQFKDVEFEEELVQLDGANWLKIKTDHFSPYALIDVLTDKELPSVDKSSDEKNYFVPTGDTETSMMILYSSIVLAISLGILVKINSKKKKLED